MSGPGYWVLSPARLPDGGVVVINRGFVPADRKDAAGSPPDAADIIGVLRLVVDFLKGLDGSGGGGPLASVLGFKIPVIDRSVSDLIHIASDFSDFVDDLVADPS